MRATRIYLILLAAIAGNISSVLALMIVARFSGSEVLGTLAYWLALAAILGVPLSLDLDSAHLRIVAIRQNPEDKARAVGAYALLKICLAAISVVVILTAAIAGFMNVDGHSQDPYFLLALSLFVVLMGLSTIFSSTFAAYGHTARQQLPQLIGSITRSVVLSLLAIAAASALWLSGSYVLGSLITLGLGVVLFRGYSVKRARKDDISEYLRVGGPLMAAPVFVIALTNLDKILLGRFWDSSTVGEYYLVQTLAFSLLLIGRAVRVVLIQGFAEDIKSGSMERIEEQSRKVAKFLILLFLPLVLFAFAFSDPYLGFVFGSSYEKTGFLLAIILAGVGVSLLADPLTSFITASGKTIKILISNIIGFAVSMVLLLALVPESIGSFRLAGLAGVGAGAAFTISGFVQIVYYRLHTRNIHSYFPLKTVSTIIVANAGALGASLLASMVLDSSHLSEFSLVLVPILFFGISFLGVFYMKALSREDLQHVRRAISTKTMTEYVKSELRE